MQPRIHDRLEIILEPFWDALYYRLEVWVFKMPTILGGHENLDTRQVCANLLRRPAYEISPEVFENTCQPMFREKITSYCYVVLALWLGLSLYQVYSLFRAILVKRLGGSQTIQIINEVNKKPTAPKNPASAIRSKETEAINKELRKIMQQLCDTLLLENYEDANKINAMKTFLARSDPIMKREITCELIGKTSPGV